METVKHRHTKTRSMKGGDSVRGVDILPLLCRSILGKVPYFVSTSQVVSVFVIRGALFFGVGVPPLYETLHWYRETGLCEYPRLPSRFGRVSERWFST